MGEGVSWLRVAKIFHLAAEFFAFLPELVEEILEGGVSQPAAQRSGAYEVSDLTFFLVQARNAETRLDDAFGILGAELSRVSPKVVCNVVGVCGKPAFGVTEAYAEDRKVLVLSRTFFSIPFLNLAPG